MPGPYGASILQTIHQAALGDDVLDERREGRGLEGLARGFVGNDAGVKIDADRIALVDCFAGCGTFENRQADVDGVAVEDAGKAFGDNAADTGRLDGNGGMLAGGAAMMSPALTQVTNVLSISSIQWLASSAALWVFR